MLPYDWKHLTPVEQAAQNDQRRQNCWNCEHLKRHRRSGYRGCELNHATAPVIAGEMNCIDWESRT